jgi:CubicO group peptidase (beta-lactamase class C family)
MLKFTVFVLIHIGMNIAWAAEVASVNPETHSGGLAKLKNNYVFPANNSPLSLDAKQLTPADQDIAALASRLIEANATTALLLIEKGKIVFEKYKAPATADSPLFSQSMSKSLTAYTIGHLLCEGKIRSLDDRAETYAPALQGTVLGEASIKHLLSMSSGAKDGITSGQSYVGEWTDIAYKGVLTIDVIKKYGQRDNTLFGSPLPGGTEFRYKAIDTYALEQVADRAAGFLTSFERTIGQPARKESKGYWLTDNSQHAQAASGASFTGRDWARLAMRSLEDLKRGNPCIQKFMQEATTTQLPNSARRVGKAFKGYGYQTWIADFGRKNSYWWIGYGGQRVGIEPDSEKIIVLTSYREDYMDSVYKLFTAWQNSK